MMFGGITVCRFRRRVFFANCVMIFYDAEKKLNLKGCEKTYVPGTCLETFPGSGWEFPIHSWVLSRKFGRQIACWEEVGRVRGVGGRVFFCRDLKLNQQFHVRKAVKRDVRCIHASKRGANLGGAVFLVPCQPWTNDIMWYPSARKARRFRFSYKRFLLLAPVLMGKFTNCTRIDFSNPCHSNTLQKKRKHETHKFKSYSSSQQQRLESEMISCEDIWRDSEMISRNRN